MDITNIQNDQIPFATGISIGSVTSPLLSSLSGNGQGLPISPYSTYAVTPLTAQVNNIALVQSVTSATTLVLTAGTGVTLITDPASPFVGCLRLDCPRALQIVVAVSSGSPTAANVIIDGYSGFGSYVRRTQAQVNTTTTANQIVYSTKAFLYVRSITVSGGVGTGGTVSVGTADILGLPFFVANRQDIISTKWLTLAGTATLNGNTPVTVSPSGIPATVDLRNADITIARQATQGTAGPFYISATTATTFELTGIAGDTSIIRYTLDFGINSQIIPGDTTTPSLTTGDTIGTITLPTPSDGSTVLRVTQYLRQTDILPNSQTITGYLGSTPYNSQS